MVKDLENSYDNELGTPSDVESLVDLASNGVNTPPAHKSSSSASLSEDMEVGHDASRNGVVAINGAQNSSKLVFKTGESSH